MVYPKLIIDIFNDSNINNLLNLIVVTQLTKEDILKILNKNLNNKLIFKSNIEEKINDALEFRRFFNKSIFEFQQTQCQVRHIIGDLPIFTDIFNRVEARGNKTILVLNLGCFSNFFLNMLNSDYDVTADLIDFCNKTNLFILNKK